MALSAAFSKMVHHSGNAKPVSLRSSHMELLLGLRLVFHLLLLVTKMRNINITLVSKSTVKISTSEDILSGPL
jgi:hypothetical protein